MFKNGLKSVRIVRIFYDKCKNLKKLKEIDLVHSPNYITQESTIKKTSKKKLHIDKKNINRINNNLKYRFQIIKGLGRNHNKRKYSRFS